VRSKKKDCLKANGSRIGYRRESARILGIGASHFKDFNFIFGFLLLAIGLSQVQRNFELWQASSFRG